MNYDTWKANEPAPAPSACDRLFDEQEAELAAANTELAALRDRIMQLEAELAHNAARSRYAQLFAEVEALVPNTTIATSVTTWKHTHPELAAHYRAEWSVSWFGPDGKCRSHQGPTPEAALAGLRKAVATLPPVDRTGVGHLVGDGQVDCEVGF